MLNLRVSLLIITLSVLSCSEPSTDNNSMPANDQAVLEMINYELNDSSLMKMPYQEKSKVVFIDSLSNILVFTIQENELETNSMGRYNEDLGKCEPSSWTEQSKEIMLFNDSLDLTFILELKTEPDHYRSDTNEFRDVLYLWTLSYPDNEEKAHSLFNSDGVRSSRHALFECVLEKRSSKYSSKWNPVDSMLIMDQTFYDVLGQDEHGSGNNISILFNLEFGILEFRDYENKYWRFSKEIN